MNNFPCIQYKTKSIFVKNIKETWIEIAKCYEQLARVQARNGSYLCQENG